ncbi:hypothetical protein A2Z33_02895 [Candidatus Gottesmanbacteria bacterium RBG_16_52_11]|uniref:Glycosyltransferase RgtA/B/C/D-like domain-containing protein n=1 Tax=Candidatus Gottesmanbacteria bacterium RBG_16_52_11 TaxID=1798374 RepID=A0A1F5YMF7_9BACT|nr:MAG: hypothetical protein A2Z33_02895 [Candidatus Gottesmanbacteria bacterium RBG_16_52_11]
MKTGIILILILLMAAVIRFYQLGLVPPSPDWDEAALGYNAYSVLKTGRDEYGTLLPVTLRSFDDYKPPLYMYLAIPGVYVFGLSVWSVRLPSAVMGVLAVWGTFILVRELFRTGKSGQQTQSEALPLLAAFLLAVSPWHVQFSRIAFEANSGITLNIWMLCLLLRARTKPVYFIPASVLAGMALYAYHSERIFIPLILIIYFLIFRREIRESRKFITVSLITGAAVVMPLMPVFFNSASWTRLRGTSSIADRTALFSTSVNRLERDTATGNPWGRVFDNRRLVLARTLAAGYLSHFSLKWLFLTGDNQRHHAPDMGLLYLVELPFFLAGLYGLVRHAGKPGKFVILWLLLAPVPAAPTSGVPHAIRTMVALPAIQVATVFGILRFWKYLTGMSVLMKRICAALLIMAAAANGYYFLDMYFRHMSYEFAPYWQYGYEQAVKYAEMHKDEYAKIVVSTRLEQSYMFFLFFTKYDPARYLASGGTASGGFAESRNRFDKYEFRPLDWPQTRDTRVLYIGSPDEIPDPGVIIRNPDGTAAIHISGT